MKTSPQWLLAVIAGFLFISSSFTLPPVTVSSTVTIIGVGGTATVSFEYPTGGAYEAPEAIINSDGFGVPLEITSHSYDPGIGDEDKWAGDATDPATGTEYTVTLMIVGNNGDWHFQSDPVVNSIVE
jgi:hypothetical protein